MPWNGTAPPPHCFLVRGVFLVGTTCRGHVGGNFGHGRERDRKDAYSHRRLLEAEGKLILYLPHLCLYLQLSFSLGVGKLLK